MARGGGQRPDIFEVRAHYFVEGRGVIGAASVTNKNVTADMRFPDTLSSPLSLDCHAVLYSSAMRANRYVDAYRI